MKNYSINSLFISLAVSSFCAPPALAIPYEKGFWVGASYEFASGLALGQAFQVFDLLGFSPPAVYNDLINVASVVDSAYIPQIYQYHPSHIIANYITCPNCEHQTLVNVGLKTKDTGSEWNKYFESGQKAVQAAVRRSNAFISALRLVARTWGVFAPYFYKPVEQKEVPANTLVLSEQHTQAQRTLLAAPQLGNPAKSGIPTNWPQDVEYYDGLISEKGVRTPAPPALKDSELTEIKHSPMGGLGLFARCKIPPGWPLGIYAGECREIGKSKGREYVAGYKLKSEIDAQRIGNKIRCSNHAFPGAGENCCLISMDSVLVLVTMKSIEPGEELLWDYGRYYWVGLFKVVHGPKNSQTIIFPDDSELKIQDSVARYPMGFNKEISNQALSLEPLYQAPRVNEGLLLSLVEIRLKEPSDGAILFAWIGYQNRKDFSNILSAVCFMNINNVHVFLKCVFIQSIILGFEDVSRIKENLNGLIDYLSENHYSPADAKRLKEYVSKFQM